MSRPGTVGRALAANEIRLLDDAGREAAPGEVGELYARNSMMITGYHRNAEATSASVRDGLFSVGDLARRDADGYYYLESRKHDMVISGGVNIYPREIEDLLLTHPAILDAAVIGVPDPEWGQRMVAVVVGTGDTAEIREWVKDRLRSSKTPDEIVFRDELPRTDNGKLLRRVLRAELETA